MILGLLDSADAEGMVTNGFGKADDTASSSAGAGAAMTRYESARSSMLPAIVP